MKPEEFSIILESSLAPLFQSTLNPQSNHELISITTIWFVYARISYKCNNALLYFLGLLFSTQHKTYDVHSCYSM